MRARRAELYICGCSPRDCHQYVPSNCLKILLRRLELVLRRLTACAWCNGIPGTSSLETAFPPSSANLADELDVRAVRSGAGS